MRATFEWRGTEYTVSGWLWSDDGAENGMIVRRADGQPIRGAKMHPGMVQTGVSRGLSRAAESALERERAARRASAR